MELRRITILSYLLVVVTAFPQLQTTENKSEITKENPPQTTINNKLEVPTHSFDEQTNNIPQMEISEIKLDDQEQEHLLELNAAISQQIDSRKARELDTTQPNTHLSQSEISKMINLISFPQSSVKINMVKPTTALEPRLSYSSRNARVHDHGYLVFAVADVSENNLPEDTNFKRLQIIPADSSLMGSAVEQGRSVNDDTDDDDVDAEEQGRFFKMKTLNKYVRRLMRMIRKGTWKVTKATFFRSAKTPVRPSFAGLYLKQASELQPIDL